MEINNEKKQSYCWPRIGSVANCSARNGIITARRQYSAASRDAMMLHAEEILIRGNAVRMVNVAGEFKITELVIQ